MAKPNTASASRLLQTALDQAAAAVAGRQAPDADTLFDLIHAVNPTGRDVLPSHRGERYRLKSQLQSLLIRRFPAVVVVQADAGSGRVIGLAHRVSRRDACHAVVDDLDEDARAWVQFRIDTGDVAEAVPASLLSTEFAVGSPSPRPTSELSNAETWLQQADQALAEYDFDAARTALEAAVVASGGSVGTALPLVELLVETLGDAAAALQWAPRLQRRGRGAGALHAYLGTAAVQVGDLAASEAYLTDAAGSLAGKAWTDLAAAAFDSCDFDLVRRAVAAARRAGPPLPELLKIEAKVQDLRQAARGPGEAEVQALWQAEDWPALQVRAQQLLAEFPDSAVARKAVRHLEERQTAQQQAAVVAAARQAIAATDWQQALALLRSAPERTSEVGALIEMAKQVLRLRYVSETAEPIAETGLQGDAAAALRALWQADDSEVAAEVERLWPSPLLKWLAVLQQAGCKVEPAVAAVLALSEVMALPTDAQPQAMAKKWDRLPALAELPQAVRLFEAHSQATAAAQKADHQQRLDKLRTLVADERWSEARAALDAWPESTGGVSAAREELARQVAAGLSHQAHHKTYQALVDAKNWIEAAHVAAYLERTTTPAQASQLWQDRARTARTLGRAGWRGRVEELAEGVPSQLPLAVCFTIDDQVAAINVHGQVPLATVVYGVFFVELLTPASSRVVRRLVFDSGRRDWAGTSLATSHGVLFAELSGTVHVLDPVELQPTRQFTVPLAPGEILRTVAWPEPGLLWLGVHEAGSKALRWIVLDFDTLATAGVVRGNYLSAQPVPGLVPPGLFLRDVDERGSFATARGKPHPLAHPPTTFAANSACVAPFDPKASLLSGEFKGTNEPGFSLSVCQQAGSKSRLAYRFSTKDVTAWHALQYSARQGRVFALVELGERKHCMLVGRVDALNEASFDVANAGNHAALVASADSERVYLLVASTAGVLVVVDPANAAAMVQAAGARTPGLPTFPALEPGLAHQDGVDQVAVTAVLRRIVFARFLGEPPPLPHSWRELPNPATQLMLVAQLLRRGAAEALHTIQPQLEELALAHPPAWLQLVAVHAHFGDWAAAVAALERCDLADLSADQAKHHRHLRAYLALMQGELQLAKQVLDECETEGEPEQPCGCAVHYWRDAVGAALALQAGDEAQGFTSMVARLTEAGRLAEAGHGPQARDELRELQLTALFQQQVAAREALAWLVDPQPRSPCQRFAETLAMAGLLSSLSPTGRMLAGNLLVPGNHWPPSQLAAIAERARARLGEHLAQLPGAAGQRATAPGES